MTTAVGCLSSRMRFAASPLLVAVAFGFLGPAALDAEEDDLEEICSDASSANADEPEFAAPVLFRPAASQAS